MGRLVITTAAAKTGSDDSHQAPHRRAVFLPCDEQDIGALKAGILDAVTTGPRFIDFSTFGHGVVSVLMMPTLGARFEVQDRTEEQVAEWDENPPIIDYETYG